MLDRLRGGLRAEPLTRGDKQEESSLHVCDPKYGLYPQVVQKYWFVFMVGSIAPVSTLFGHLPVVPNALVLSLLSVTCHHKALHTLSEARLL